MTVSRASSRLRSCSDLSAPFGDCRPITQPVSLGCTASADISLLGDFKGSVPKPAPPSDHTPLRRRCAFSECRPFLMFFKSTPGRRGNLIIRSPPPLRLLPVTESVALPPEARWNAMTDYPAAIPMFAIQQLRCPKCRAHMKLARTSPGPTGFEIKRFDCSECNHVEQIAIPSDDPMKSA